MVKVSSNKGEETMSQGNGPSSIDSDGSFVVLERSTTREHTLFPNGDSMQPRSMPPSSSMGPTQDNNAPSSYLGGSLSSLSLDEIQKKLQEVVQENVELKETLQQNNLAMKQQFNTLIMWQEEVYKVHQNHKEKFQETKELILKLRAENSELKNYLEKCGSTSDIQLTEENAKLKGQIAELQQKLSAPIPRPHTVPTKKEEELSDLVKQLNTQLETAQRSRRQLELDVERLAARQVKNDREIAELKLALQDYDLKCSELLQKNAELHQKVLQSEPIPSMVIVDKPEDSISDPNLPTLKSELEMTRSHLMEMKTQLDEEKQVKSNLLSQMQLQEAVLQDLQKKVQTMSSEKGQSLHSFGKDNLLVVNCEEQMKKLNRIFLSQTWRYEKLDNLLQNSQSEIEQWQPSLHGNDAEKFISVKAQMEQLMRILAQEQAYSQGVKKQVEENQNDFQKLLIDYQTLLHNLQTQNQDESDKVRHNNEYLNVQSKALSEKVDHLMAQVLCKDEELKENEKEIEELKEKLSKIELENGMVTILRAQVEVYRADFKAEREARESIAGEKDRLAEDLRHLQRRNQQLLEELESYQRAQFNVLQNTSNSLGNGGRGSVSPNRLTVGNQQNSSGMEPRQRASPEVDTVTWMYDEDVPPPKEYVCPMCSMGFRQLQQLEYHVETCLDS